jgi:hypothetical protein
MCGANLLQRLTNTVFGVPSLDSLFQSWLRSLGVDISSDSTYASGQVAGLILSLAARRHPWRRAAAGDGAAALGDIAQR